MAGFSIIENFSINYNEPFLATAASLEPELFHTEVKPLSLPENALRKGDSIELDLGNHYVGYMTLELDSVGSHPDAPAYIYLKFGENKRELSENTADYNSWISKSWLQEEYIHVDVLPAIVRLPRRYAFRYLSITCIDTSAKYALRVKDVTMDAVSAVSTANVPALNSSDEMLDKIDAVSVYTLKECMQSVFEDGPKRDRRLWLGDLRMQARVNYATYKNFDLVKRCLYLFAGMTFNEGKISACLFTEPKPEPDDTYLIDYAMIYVPTLLEYCEASGDREALEQLYPYAIDQLKIAYKTLDERGIVEDGGDAFWCFLDWSEGLNKQCGAQAVMIYATGYGIKLAELMGDAETAAYLTAMKEKCVNAALTHLWDPDKQLFISGEGRQVSWASQVWMILAGVLSTEENLKLIERAESYPGIIGMVTPYMNHHYVEALINCGRTDKAIAHIKRYWGGMIQQGADTFWELYDPANPDASPYGSAMANSYCHAWSCSPAYILRRSMAD